MRKLFVPAIALLFLACTWQITDAQVRLPDIFSDNMVLQQQTTVNFHGWADPLQKVKVVASWDPDTLSVVTPSDAIWSVQLHTPKAGGPYRITVIGDTTLVIHNILIGEVWTCTGQSNMQMNATWKINNYKEEIANANHPEIRFFRIDLISAPWPQVEVRGKWEVCTPKSMPGFSAAGYFFGRELNERLHEPVGLIQSCWGGSPVEAWTPIGIFEHNEKLAMSAAKLTPAPWAPMRPAVAFNAMINPIIKFPIAGSIWYQGETNVVNPGTYEETFADMIHSWRQLWHEDFPFYFVQIAPFAYNIPESAALVREAQLQTYRNVPNTGMVVTTDITGDTTNIHPKDKQDVGKRLALWALSQHYGIKGIVPSGPLYRSMDVSGNKAIIHFDFAKDGLTAQGGELRDFVIAGEDHKFVPAMAVIQDNRVVVSSPKVKHPVAVRMGFTNTAIPNLFNKDGLPASPFRTDHWKVGKSNK